MNKDNLEKFLAYGPRLRNDYTLSIVARRDGHVLLDGVGGCGVGQMWVAERPHHKDYPGYETAPKQ